MHVVMTYPSFLGYFQRYELNYLRLLYNSLGRTVLIRGKQASFQFILLEHFSPYVDMRTLLRSRKYSNFSVVITGKPVFTVRPYI